MTGLGLARQLGLLAGQATLTAALLLSLYSLRRQLGLIPLYVTVGALQQLQVIIALSIYVEFSPGLLISPGSTVLFTGTLFAVLLVYVREDALEARRLIYGVLASNLALALLLLLLGAQVGLPETRNFLDLPRELFLRSPRVTLVGTVTLLLDALLIIVLYEAVSASLGSLFLRVYVTMAAVLTFDTLAFVTGSFAEHPEYVRILVSGLTGKLGVAVLYATVLTLYLGRLQARDAVTGARHGELKDLFAVLTYRQRYEAIRDRVGRDALTGLDDRGRFEETLRSEVHASKRRDRPVTLMLVDVDHFKRINDQFGHPEGDRALRAVADVLQSSVRARDSWSRVGGEEFAAVLPETDAAVAFGLAQRLRAALTAHFEATEPPYPWRRLTVTVGIAECPSDATSADALVAVADRRLYAGKQAGRDRVVASGV